MNEVAEKGPSREKYWEECDAEQKLDRLRDNLARACRIIQGQEKQIAQLMAHQHSANGILLSPLYGGNEALGNLSGGAFTHDMGIPYNLRTKRERRD